MSNPKAPKRRQMLLATASGLTLAGAAGAWHTLKNQTYPRGAALPVDISRLQAGKLLTLEWQAKPVWVLRRTPEELTALSQHNTQLADAGSAHSHQPSACQNHLRSVRPDIFVTLGVCTHQGCTPNMQAGVGFLCPCHGSRYDLAGRVFKAGPATANLVIPAYHFASETQLVIGTEA